LEDKRGRRIISKVGKKPLNLDDAAVRKRNRVMKRTGLSGKKKKKFFRPSKMAMRAAGKGGGESLEPEQHFDLTTETTSEELVRLWGKPTAPLLGRASAGLAINGKGSQGDDGLKRGNSLPGRREAELASTDGIRENKKGG